MRKLLAASTLLVFVGPVSGDVPPPSPSPSPTPGPTASPTLVSLPPTPTPTPAPTVKQRIINAWPGDTNRVIRLVACETGNTFNPRIVGPHAHDDSHYRGLFQMDATFWKTYGGLEYAARPDLATVEEQVKVAWRGRQDRHYRPWPVCGYR